MSDEAIRAAWRRWKADPTPENALLWAVAQDRSMAPEPTVDVAFKEASSRATRAVAGAMTGLHGDRTPGPHEILLSDVARLSRRQWRGLGNCGDVTIREIASVLERHGLVMSATDDDLVETRRLIELRAGYDNAVRRERDAALRERDAASRELARVARERDVARAALSKQPSAADLVRSRVLERAVKPAKPRTIWDAKNGREVVLPVGFGRAPTGRDSRSLPLGVRH